jgi:hypothetical protein
MELCLVAEAFENASSLHPMESPAGNLKPVSLHFVYITHCIIYRIRDIDGLK